MISIILLYLNLYSLSEYKDYPIYVCYDFYIIQPYKYNYISSVIDLGVYYCAYSKNYNYHSVK